MQSEANDNTDDIDSGWQIQAGTEGAEIAEGAAADFTISTGAGAAAGVGVVIILFFGIPAADG